MRPRRGRAVALVVAVGVAGLASCGLPNDKQYSAIKSSDIPFGISDTTTTTSTTIAPAPTTTVPRATTTTVPTTTVTLYFVMNGHLYPVPRAMALPATPAKVLGQLQSGPDETDKPSGLRSAVPNQSVGNVSVTGGIATVDLSPTFVQPTPAATDPAPVANVDQPLAFGEIVLTLTSLPGIGQVRFTVGGQQQPALAADGSLVDTPVSADNYAALRSA